MTMLVSHNPSSEPFDLAKNKSGARILYFFDVVSSTQIYIVCATGVHYRARHNPRSFRPCSVIRDWSPGLIPSRITSLIYIDFDELD
jgi:predicted metal-dependent phosphotriesterase family hydrolase